MKQKRFFLPENEIPTQWYNIQADMPNKPMPMLNPKTGEPVTEGWHFLLQGIFPTQGSNPGLLHCRQTLYPLSNQGSHKLF